MYKDDMAIFIKLIIWICFYGICIVILTSIFNKDSTEFINEKVVELEKYNIVKSSNNNKLSGSGGGSYMNWSMEISESNVFVFYSKNKSNEIERREIPFNFKIQEEDRENVELVLYQKNITENICKELLLSFNDKTCAEETRTDSQYYILYVPLGTFDGSINLN